MRGFDSRRLHLFQAKNGSRQSLHPWVIESGKSRDSDPITPRRRPRFEFSPRQALDYNDHPDAIIEDFSPNIAGLAGHEDFGKPAAGGQVKSTLPLLGYMKHGEPQARAMGLKMPPPNLQPDFEEQAKTFVDGLVDGALQPVAAGAEE